MTNDLFSSGLSSSNVLFAKSNAANFFVKSCCSAVLPREQRQWPSPTTSLRTLNCARGAAANNTSFTVATQEIMRVAGCFFFNAVHFHYPARQALLNAGPLQPHAPQGPKGCWVPRGYAEAAPGPGAARTPAPAFTSWRNPLCPSELAGLGVLFQSGRHKSRFGTQN